MEAIPELSAKDIKAAEEAARKIELAAKKDARLTAKKASISVDDIGEVGNLNEEVKFDGSFV